MVILPADIAKMIFCYFDMFALICLATISKKWRKLIGEIASEALSKFSEQLLVDSVARMRVILRCAELYPDTMITPLKLFKNITGSDFVAAAKFDAVTKVQALMFTTSYTEYATRDHGSRIVKRIVDGIAMKCVGCVYRFKINDAEGIVYPRKKNCICSGRICGSCNRKLALYCCIKVYGCSHDDEEQRASDTSFCVQCGIKPVCRKCCDMHRFCRLNGGNICSDCRGPSCDYEVDGDTVLTCKWCVDFAICYKCGKSPDDRQLRSVTGGFLCNSCDQRVVFGQKCRYYRSRNGCRNGNACKFAHD